MSEILFLVIFTSTKISEIFDMTKCLENFVSQTLGLFIKNYAAELRDYFELSEKPSLTDFKSMCNYTDLWSRCYRRSDSSKHLNGCKNIDIDLIAEKQAVFEDATTDKDAWFKENIGKIPCFYTTPTSREFVDVDAVYSVALNVDNKLVQLLECAGNGVCYLGNSEGWVDISIKRM